MSKHLETSDRRVLNGLGPFASLYDINFTEIKNPVLVLKSEEPGSKQKIAMEYGYTESICHDMINHLMNDIVVMGAKPLAVLDTIVCGNAEKDTIKTLVKGVSEACKENECSLVGGETSIQPLVVESGVYVLASSIAGIVEKSKVIDGSAIEEGDVVLAIASNGLTFIEQIMKPHTPYYKSIKALFNRNIIHEMAHIIGGGIEGNLCRIIPDDLSAKIDLSKVRILNIFKYIRNSGNISDEEMLRTFNCGVGFNLVVSQRNKAMVMKHINQFYEIGKIEKEVNKVIFEKRMNWL